MDQMMDMMEKYTNNLEDLVNQRTIAVHEEKRKTEDLLHRMLPAWVTSTMFRIEGKNKREKEKLFLTNEEICDELKTSRVYLLVKNNLFEFIRKMGSASSVRTL